MPFWKRRKPEERLAALISEAEEALKQREFERALRAGEKLVGLQHTYGFEIKARALAALDREPEALRVMEESVTIAPSVAPLWSFLGEYRSNAGDYAGAHAAFARAGELDPVMLPECLLNEAIVFLRETQPERAWETLERISTPTDLRLRGEIASWRADTLLQLGRNEQTIELCTRELDWGEAAVAADPTVLDMLTSSRDELRIAQATALWRSRKDGEAALELCYAAVKHTGSRGAGFELIREIGGLDASRAKCFQLLCHGKALTRFFEKGVAPESVPETEHGYLTTFRVLADTPEEALEFVERSERREWGEKFRSLVLEKSSEAPDKVTGCKGIYFRGGRTFYSGRDDKS